MPRMRDAERGLIAAAFSESTNGCPESLLAQCAAREPRCPTIEQPNDGANERAILPRVIERDALTAELQATWHREIPLAAAMGIEVASYDGHDLVVRAPFDANRNVHGTAFAGSLFSVCVLTGWGATWLGLREAQLTGVIVVADSRIQYRKAVAGTIECRCRPDAAALDVSRAQLVATGRASLELACTIDAADKLAVRFDAKYVVQAKHGN